MEPRLKNKRENYETQGKTGEFSMTLDFLKKISWI